MQTMELCGGTTECTHFRLPAEKYMREQTKETKNWHTSVHHDIQNRKTYALKLKRLTGGNKSLPILDTIVRWRVPILRLHGVTITPPQTLQHPTDSADRYRIKESTGIILHTDKRLISVCKEKEYQRLVFIKGSSCTQAKAGHRQFVWISTNRPIFGQRPYVPNIRKIFSRLLVKRVCWKTFTLIRRTDGRRFCHTSRHS